MKTRRFTIFDAMVLIAATAVGIGGMRALGAVHQLAVFVRPVLGWSVYEVLRRIAESTYVFVPCLASWTVALCVVRLRQPRPRFPRLAHQPGTVACGVASLVVVAGVLEYWIRTPLKYFLVARRKMVGRGAYISLWEYCGTHFYVRMWEIAYPIGILVLMTWIALALSRLWRSEPSWIDRTGRVLGVAWIACGLTYWSLEILREISDFA